jgi:hypothetical protein
VRLRESPSSNCLIHPTVKTHEGMRSTATPDGWTVIDYGRARELAGRAQALVDVLDRLDERSRGSER